MTTQTIDLHQEDAPGEARACMSRRRFLLAGGVLVTLAALPGGAVAAVLKALKSEYPEVLVGRVSQLKTGVPVEFSYPYPDVSNVLVKLGAPAGGGVGPAADIVAFNQQCPHMGGPLQGTYKAQHQMLGPCPLHLTTFDLTRHGMVVSGHSTESLPQIVLQVRGDDIYAIAVQGLIFGYSANLNGHRA